LVLVSSIGHTQSSRSSTILGLYNLVPSKLHPRRESLQLILRHPDRGLGLAEERDNRLATVSTDDGNAKLSRGCAAGDFGGECRGADDVEGGDAKEFLGVEYFLGFEDFGNDGDSAVYGVGDDEDKGIGTVCGDAFGEVTDDAGVDLE